MICGATYLLNVFFPEKIKSAIEEFVDNNLGQKIEIAKISLNVIRGITLGDVALYEKGAKNPYAKIKTLRIMPFLASFFTQQKLISACELDNVYYALKRNEDGTLAAAFLSRLQNNSTLFISTLSVKKLFLDFEDKTINFNKKIANVSFKLNFGMLSPWLNFEVAWDNKVFAKGKYNRKTNTLKAQASIRNMNLAEYAAYMGTLDLKSGYIKKAELQIEGETAYLIKGNAAINDIWLFCPISPLGDESLSRAGSAQDTQTKQIVEYKGNLVLNNLGIRLAQKSFSYALGGYIERSEFKNLPLVGELKDTWAAFSLDQEKLTLRAFKTNFKGNYLIAKGEIRDFNEPKVYAEGRSYSQLPNAIGAMQLLGDFWFPWQTQGKIGLTFIVRGNLKEAIFDYLIDYRIREGQINDFKNIEATGHIQNNLISLDEASLEYKKIPLKIKGKLENIVSGTVEGTEAETGELKLSLEGGFSSTLTKAVAVAKSFKDFPFTYTGKGMADISFAIKGNPQKNNLDYSIDYHIRDAEIKDLKSIEANGTIKNDALILKNATASWKDKPLEFSGTMENFPSPEIALNIKGDIFNIEAQAKYTKDLLTIKALTIKAKSSKLSTYGSVELKKQALELKGVGIIVLDDVSDILKFFEVSFSPLNTLRPQGVLSAKFAITGGFTMPTWGVKLTGFSEKIRVGKLAVEALKFELLRDKDKLILSPLVARLAQGAIDIRTKFDFPNKKAIANIVANDVDLSELNKQLKWEGKKLAGKLSLEAYLENNGLKEWEKLDGYGKIELKEGNIWELNFLTGFGEYLFIPDFAEIPFKEGYSDLLFKADKVIFENLRLHSFQMDLEGAGTITRSGNIHFMLLPQFNPDLIAASEGLRKITTHFLGKSGLLIEIQGTLAKPTYTTKPLLFSPLTIQKINNFFRNLEK